MTFTCPRCGMISHNPNDAENGYCGACGAFTGNEPARYGQLPLLNMAELRVLLGAVDRQIALLTPRHTTGTEVGSETIAMLRSERTVIAEAMSGAQPVDTLTRVTQLRARLAAAPAGEGGRATVKEVLADLETLMAEVRHHR